VANECASGMPWDASTTELFDIVNPCICPLIIDSFNLHAELLHLAQSLHLLSMKRNVCMPHPPLRYAIVVAHTWDSCAVQKLGMKTINVPCPIKSKEEGVEVDFVVKNFEENVT